MFAILSTKYIKQMREQTTIIVIGRETVKFKFSDEASKKHPFPCPCTYRTALSHYLDITSVPRTHILRELAEYAAEDKDKEFLLQITSPTPEGKVSNSEH